MFVECRPHKSAVVPNIKVKHFPLLGLFNAVHQYSWYVASVVFVILWFMLLSSAYVWIASLYHYIIKGYMHFICISILFLTVKFVKLYSHEMTAIPLQNCLSNVD
jgi:hypothetical protein